MLNNETPTEKNAPDSPLARNNSELSMTEEAVNEYMSSLMKNESPSLNGMEAEILNLFKSTSLELNKTVQKLKQTQNDAAQLDGSAQRLQGELNAYANLLVKAEGTRRVTRKETT